MRLFLDEVHERPVRARVAADDAVDRAARAARLPARSTQTSFANARGTEVEERVYTLD